MSDTGDSSGNDPYDPSRPPPPPPAPGSEPQPGWGGGAMSSGQWGSAQPPQYGGGEYGQPPAGQGQYGQYGQGYGQSPGTPPPNHLVPAILATVFCCLPLGIASIVFAAQVNSKYSAGDIAGAQDASRKAKQFAIWSAVAGLIVVALYVIFAVLAIASGTSTTSSWP